MRAHVSIKVKDVEVSVKFYKELFGKGPQKQTPDYAKFDLDEPALNFSMTTGRPGKLSRVSHFGIEVDSPLDIQFWKTRLEKAGLSGETEEQVACCYALQDKVWFTDPDGNSWEIFHVHGQLPTTGPIAKSGESCSPTPGSRACCAS